MNRTLLTSILVGVCALAIAAALTVMFLRAASQRGQERGECSRRNIYSSTTVAC